MEGQMHISKWDVFNDAHYENSATIGLHIHAHLGGTEEKKTDLLI